MRLDSGYHRIGVSLCTDSLILFGSACNKLITSLDVILVSWGQGKRDKTGRAEWVRNVKWPNFVVHLAARKFNARIVANAKGSPSRHFRYFYRKFESSEGLLREGGPGLGERAESKLQDKAAIQNPGVDLYTEEPMRKAPDRRGAALEGAMLQ